MWARAQRTASARLLAIPAVMSVSRVSRSSRRSRTITGVTGWPPPCLFVPRRVLAFRPRCAVVVLNRADWSERASNPLYGMPYYSAGNLFLAGEPSDLAARIEEVAGTVPPAAAQVLDQVYGTGAGRVHPAAGRWLASWHDLQGEG